MCDSPIVMTIDLRVNLTVIIYHISMIFSIDLYSIASYYHSIPINSSDEYGIMKQIDDYHEYELERKTLTDNFRSAQDLFDRAIKEKVPNTELLDQAIQKLKDCEILLNQIDQKYSAAKWGFESFLKDSFFQNFRHTLYFTLGDILKYKRDIPFDVITMYMEKSKSTGICDHAVPTTPLYTPQRKYPIKAAILSVKSNTQNPQYMIDFMCAHLYHHGLGNYKANYTMANTLYSRAIKACSDTHNEDAKNLQACFYLNYGLFHIINPQNIVDFDKAAENFMLAIQHCNQENTKFGFIALMEWYFLISGQVVKNTLSQFDILIFKKELEIFAQNLSSAELMTKMLIELSKKLLYDPRKEAFEFGQRLMLTIAEKTQDSTATLAYANSLLHGIIPSQISAPPPKKINLRERLKKSLEWHSKCEKTENKYSHFNIGCILFELNHIFDNNKLTKKQVITLYNSKNSKHLPTDISDLELRKKLISCAIYRMNLALPDPTGAVHLVLASAYFELASVALLENNLKDHLKYYKLHLQSRTESFDMDIQSLVRNEQVARRIEAIQEEWQNQVSEDALAERQKQIKNIQIDINSEIIEASKMPSQAPSTMLSHLLQRFLSPDYKNATDTINISTLTKIIGKLFTQNAFDADIYSENSTSLNALFNQILEQDTKGFTPRDFHNIFCGLSCLRISSKHKLYTKCVNSMLSGLFSSMGAAQTLPSSLTMTPYLCDLFHSISRLEMPNACVNENIELILNCAQSAFQTADLEEVINMLYPLAKIHTTLLNAKEPHTADRLNTLLSIEIDKLSHAIPSHPTFERLETVHQWYLLVQSQRQLKKIPEEKDLILKKFKNFFDKHFEKNPINQNTIESNLQKKFTSLIIKTLKPHLKNAKFFKEFVINGLPVDIVIKIPKIRNKRPSLYIPIQIHGSGHFFHESGGSLLLNSNEYFHQLIIGNPVILTYQDFEMLQNKTDEEVFGFLQKKLLPLFSISPTDSKDKSDQVNVWQVVH